MENDQIIMRNCKSFNDIFSVCSSLEFVEFFQAILTLPCQACNHNNEDGEGGEISPQQTDILSIMGQVSLTAIVTVKKFILRHYWQLFDLVGLKLKTKL